MTEVWFIVLVLHGAPVNVLSPLDTKKECEAVREHLEASQKGTKPEFKIHCVKGERP